MKIKLIKLYVLIFVLVFSGFIFGGPRSSEYVGSSKCITCHSSMHPKICRGWQHTPHHLVMKEISEDEDIPGDFSVNSVFKKEDIKYIIGYKSGRYTYIGFDFTVFPLQWMEKDSAWKERASADASMTCFGCHTTGYFVSSKEFVEPGIGCEVCHGPGEKHVKSEGSIEFIVNPKKLSRDRSRMICGQCHSAGNDPSGKFGFPIMSDGIDSATDEKILRPFIPGEDLTLGFVDAKPKVAKRSDEYSSLMQAPDYFAKLICTDCHDPHNKQNNPSMLIDASNGTCLKCHEDYTKDLAVHKEVDKKHCWECHKYAHTH
ncbi:cytochrome c3 family protein [candidate division KSB1 bacterium]